MMSLPRLDIFLSHLVIDPTLSNSYGLYPASAFSFVDISWK